jgi:glucose/arabinose dehydrogenase
MSRRPSPESRPWDRASLTERVDPDRPLWHGRLVRPLVPPLPAVALAVLLALAGAGCGRSQAASPPRWDRVRLARVAEGLDNPVWLTAPPGDTTRLFVVEQTGRIRILRGGQVLPVPFLDLRDRVRSGGERGLLSVAFHPRYHDNGWLFVDYTDRHGDTRIERYHVSADPDRADPASAFPILGIAQPYPNHNGGLVMFGPDGMLWIGMGDGGSGGDPQNRAENGDELLGKMLRIDVDHGEPYTIPRGNAYPSGGGRGEIWAIGLRNPWRFSFDPARDDLWIGDVGQNAWEEVDRASTRATGLDFGWRRYEGTHAYKPAEGRPPVMPVLEYPHAEGCSVIGGFVYRGHAVPALAGQYVYADYCSGWIRSVPADSVGIARPRLWDVARPGAISSFGLDARSELYVLTLDGTIDRVVARP